MGKLPDLPTVHRLDGGEMRLLTTKQAMNAVASLEGPASNDEPVDKWRNIAIVLAHEVQRLREQIEGSK